MRTTEIGRDLVVSACIIMASVFLCSAARPLSPSDATNEDQVEFRVLSDKLVYARGESIIVTDIVVNSGQTPLHLSRCQKGASCQVGFADVKILDGNGRNVCNWGLAEDQRPWTERDVVALVSDSRLWVTIGPNEIYGGEMQFKLPDQKGEYRITGELFPPGFTEREFDILAENHIRVLRNPHEAPSVTIRVK